MKKNIITALIVAIWVWVSALLWAKVDADYADWSWFDREIVRAVWLSCWAGLCFASIGVQRFDS